MTPVFDEREGPWSLRNRGLKQRARDAAKRVLRIADIDAGRWSRSYEGLRVRYLHDMRVSAVIDVGASIGDYAAELRSLGFRGRLLSIEPLNMAFDLLAQRSAQDGLWDCVQCGLGAHEGNAVLGVSHNWSSSSILPVLATSVDAAPESRRLGDQLITVRTLDSVVAERLGEDATLGLKLDVQGYEDEVLKGAQEAISKVVFLEVELSLVSLYHGQPLYLEMLALIQELGFSLVNLDSGFADPRTGRVLQFDGIFLRLP